MKLPVLYQPRPCHSCSASPRFANVKSTVFSFTAHPAHSLFLLIFCGDATCWMNATRRHLLSVLNAFSVS